MSNSTNITYTDTDGQGNLTLVANPFDNGNSYFARFDRTTVNIDNLIARIQKKELGTNALTAKHMASLFKAEILEALGRGEAVNLLDLGTLYITTKGSMKGGTPETAEIPGFSVKFTASKITNQAVSSIAIKKIVISEQKPIIGMITDRFSGKIDSVLTAGKVCKLEGTRLKITGKEGGIYFAPAAEDGNPAADVSSWVKAQNLLRNTSKYLEFFIPSELSVGKDYCIVLKTNCMRSASSQMKYETASTKPVCIVEE